MQLARDALANGDHEVVGEEDADLAGVDLLAFVVVACRAQDDQFGAVLVLLGLRPQVEGRGVLDSELVQSEDLADPVQLLGTRFEDAQPDESALPAARGRLLQWHRALVLSTPVAVMCAVDDHGLPPHGRPMCAASCPPGRSAPQRPHSNRCSSDSAEMSSQPAPVAALPGRFRPVTRT